MTYELQWTLLNPEKLVYQSDNGHDRVCRVDIIDQEQDLQVAFVLAQFMDWDCYKFGISHKWLDMPYYSGGKQIANLDLCPMRYRPDVQGLKQKCISRGQRREKNRRIELRQFKGVGRVMVNELGEDFPKSLSMTVMNNDPTYAPEISFVQQGTLEAGQLLLATPWIRGLGFTDRKDELFSIDDIEDVIWNNESFSNVVLAKEIEDILVPLAEKQAKQNQRKKDGNKGDWGGLQFYSGGLVG